MPDCKFVENEKYFIEKENPVLRVQLTQFFQIGRFFFFFFLVCENHAVLGQILLKFGWKFLESN